MELGLPMVRAVGTGISAVIDGRGGCWSLGRGRASDEDDGVLTATVPIVPAGVTTRCAAGPRSDAGTRAMAVAAGVADRRAEAQRRGPMIWHRLCTEDAMRKIDTLLDCEDAG